MAIQLAGNTVIHDNQNVQVSGVTTASSFVGDGSQLTNLPPSGGSLTATASGTLADGSKVIVNADGTVSVVSQTQTQTETTGAGIESEVIFQSSHTDFLTALYDSANQKVVIVYRDQGDNGCKVVVGTVSGTSISFGSPVTFDSQLNDVSAAYDSANQKIVIAYRDGVNNSYGTAIVGTVSGTSASFGTPTVYDSTYCNETSVVYDSTNQKVVICYQGGSSFYGRARVGTVSGNSISFGSDSIFNSSGQTRDISAAFDSANGKVIVSYCDYGNNFYGGAAVGTVSGTSISFGSEVVFESATTTNISSVYDPTNGKVVIAYRDSDNSGYGTAIVGTVSGTSISFGTPVVFNPTYTVFTSTVFDSANNKVIIAYQNRGNDSHGTVIAGTVSGTSISFDTASTFSFSTSSFISAVYDPNSNKVIAAFQNGENNDYGTAVLIGTTGFSIPQLTATVFETANSRPGAVVYDSTNQKVVIVYKDTGNSDYGTAIVGTVSGTSISFGTPVVFLSASIGFFTATYDSSNSKVVIIYQDFGNSQYGTGIVGTVSGTSISFGSPTVFNTAKTEYIGATYDSSNQKVVIAYSNGGSTPQVDYGEARVGTVSGTSISFGSPTTFVTAQAVVNLPIYDSTNQKVVIAYRTGGTNYGTAIVGTVSGTSISFGSPSTFSPGNATTIISAAYDSSNQKVVIAYRDPVNSNYGTAIVGTVSGTSISFGSPVVFNSNGNTFNILATYDSINQKIFIAYTDAGNSQYGTVIEGTVSGTSISFGSAFVFESAISYNIKAAYDSSNDKLVIGYRDDGNSGYGTAVVYTPRTIETTITKNLTAENFIGISNGAYSDGQTATIQISGSIDDAQSGLTPGQKYYVQNDGTLSETADSPSVFAGTAVASTKLIING